MIATVYTWEGEPEDGAPRALGQVRVVGGRAEWDESLERVMARIALSLDPAQGEAFVAELPHRLRNAPYCWAETSAS